MLGQVSKNPLYKGKLSSVFMSRSPAPDNVFDMPAINQTAGTGTLGELEMSTSTCSSGSARP